MTGELTTRGRKVCATRARKFRHDLPVPFRHALARPNQGDVQLTQRRDEEPTWPSRTRAGKEPHRLGGARGRFILGPL